MKSNLDSISNRYSSFFTEDEIRNLHEKYAGHKRFSGIKSAIELLFAFSLLIGGLYSFYYSLLLLGAF